MKLHVFHAGDGDCMLVETADANLLVDGGRKGTFTSHTTPAMKAIATAGGALDAICVSHIDADHISGVLRLFDDMIARRRHLFQTGDPTTGPYQPPDVVKLWHNGFEAQLGERSSDLADLLVKTSTTLSASSDRELRAQATFQRNLALSERQSARLSLQAVGVLGLDVNPEAAHQALVVENNPVLSLGASAEVRLLAPFQVDLDTLQGLYVTWLENNSPILEDIVNDMKDDLAGITDEVDRLIVPLRNAAAKLGDRGEVTAPNLASIMLYIEEDGRTCLLTGDGHSDDVVKGLEHHGLLQPGSGLHVDILKIPHHGSEFNIDMQESGQSMRSEFLRRITADHYVLCGNGAHENPDKRVVKAIIDSRLGPASVRSPNSETCARFKLWFTTHPDRVTGDERTHLLDLKSYVAGRQKDRFDHEWLETDAFVI